MTEQENDKAKQQKNIAYYTALVNAWIQTKMEHDKTLISLSAGGIALLITILSTVGVKHRWEFLLYGVALLSFIVTAAISMFIFDRNSKYIETILIKKKESRDNVLRIYDKLSRCFFILAVLVSVTIGIVTAYNKLNESNEKGDLQMCDEKKTEDTKQEKILTEKSLNGLGELNPTEPEENVSPDELTGDSDSGKQSD